MRAFYGPHWTNKEQGKRSLWAAFGLGIQGCGDLLLVKKESDADYRDWVSVFHDGVFNTITAALAACVDGRGDTIIVCPGTYTEAVTISKADVSIIGLGKTPHRTVINGDGSVAVTITAVGVALENLHIKTSGAAIACVYGTGLVGAPRIHKCDFTQLTLTSIACVNIAGATSRGLIVTNCNFLGASASADAVNYAGKQALVMNNTAEDLNTTEATCFGVTSYHTGSSNLAV